MQKKGIIFDLDGVIVDTAKYHFLAWKNLAESLDINFNKKQNEQLKGVSRIESLKKILTWGKKRISEKRFNELLHQKNEEYLVSVQKMDESEILPGVMKRLKMLKDVGHPIALGSASKNAKTILERVNLMPYFDVIVDGNEVSKAKPNPEVFLKAAQLLGVEPENAIVFEDALAGIEAANRAKMLSVGIGEKSILKDADFVFADFTEITDKHFNAILNASKAE
ncbi:beta-phosphoglucomutase [Psychroflexus planctonicus]|uniref:Beta-phosphoglucomutase n=1 Tax=Psychroflexus planctonicus TaxID=1526575 RepID=A0ABQ1SEI4_9FLAO|nr:beta-phosphoglucomutase [Psychroflexus planctonicus]GGE32709.1 beta-phosphoglucomutase [Psychroflexus planctonicus]